MSHLTFIDSSFAIRFATTLLHFLWQAGLIAALSLAGEMLLTRNAAWKRYLLHVTALLVMAACVPVTFFCVRSPESPAAQPGSVAYDLPDRQRQGPEQPVAAEREPVVAEVPPVLSGPPTLPADPVVAATPASSQPAAPAADRFSLVRLVQPWAPQITVLYFVCFALLLARLIRGAWGGHRLRQRSVAITAESLLGVLERQARRLGLRVAPTMAWCAEVSIPVVVGVVKPMILLPTAAATGLSPDQLETLITHELAHIRRYDLVVNLLQRLIEAALFFHPAVWFISRRIDSERELACDELVLATGCERLRYADALVRMAELSAARRGLKPTAPATSLAAAGANSSEFKRRVLKVLAAPASSQLRPSRTGLLLVLVSLILGVTLMATRLSINALGLEFLKPENGEPPDESVLKSLDSAPMSECRALLKRLDDAGNLKLAAMARERLAKRWKSISEQPVESFLRELPKPDPKEVQFGGPLVGVQTDLDGVWSSGKGTADNWKDWIVRKQNGYRVGRLHMLFDAAAGYRKVEDAASAKRVLQAGLAGHEIFDADLKTLLGKYWPVTDDSPAKSLDPNSEPVAWTLANYLGELSSAQQKLGEVDAAIATHSRLTLAHFMLSWKHRSAGPTKHARELWALIRQQPKPTAPLFWFNLVDEQQPKHTFDLSSAGQKAQPLTYHHENLAVLPPFEFAELTITAQTRGHRGLLDCYRINAAGKHETIGLLQPSTDGEAEQTLTKTFRVPAGTSLVQFMVAGEEFQVGKVTVQATFAKQVAVATSARGEDEKTDNPGRVAPQLGAESRSDPATTGNSVGTQPQSKESQALFQKWLRAARDNGSIPGGTLGPLVRVMTTFVKNNPTHDGAPKFAELLKRVDVTRDWSRDEAVKLLDEVAAIYPSLPKWVQDDNRFRLGGDVVVGKPLPDELKDAPWGEAKPNGLRAAWLLEPRGAEYRLNTPLKSRVLFHNSGKHSVVFRALTWNQSSRHKARTAQGAEININSTYWTTIPMVFACRLAPGEFLEVVGAGIGVGANMDDEDWRDARTDYRVGAWIEAQAGDEVIFSPDALDCEGREAPQPEGGAAQSAPQSWWLTFITDRLSLDAPLPAAADERGRLLDRAMRDLFGNAPTEEELAAFKNDATPAALEALARQLAERSGFESFSGSLTSGPTTFRVLPVDPDAAKKPRTAKNPGQYKLGGNVTFVVRRRPIGDRVVNEAHLAFAPTDDSKPAARESHPVPLPDDYDSWIAAWMRGGTVLWVAQKGADQRQIIRRYDFTNPASVKETVISELTADEALPQVILDAVSPPSSAELR